MPSQQGGQAFPFVQEEPPQGPVNATSVEWWATKEQHAPQVTKYPSWKEISE